MCVSSRGCVTMIFKKFTIPHVASASHALRSPEIFLDKANVRIVKLKAIAGVKTLPK